MRAVFLVFTSPVSPEKDAEYNEWYDQVHLPAILELDGFVRASRWKLSSARTPDEALAERPYLAVYELDTEDVPAAFNRLQEANSAGQLGSSIGILATEPPTMTATFELVSEIER